METAMVPPPDTTEQGRLGGPVETAIAPHPGTAEQGREEDHQQGERNGETVTPGTEINVNGKNGASTTPGNEKKVRFNVVATQNSIDTACDN